MFRSRERAFESLQNCLVVLQETDVKIRSFFNLVSSYFINKFVMF